MSWRWMLLALPLCGPAPDAGLDEARLLIQRGFLSQAEQRLEARLAAGPDDLVRARVHLLLGNVDYERGHYARALERYTEAERSAAADAQLAEGAAGNRRMAEERLARGRKVGDQAARLGNWLVVTLVLIGLVVGWLVRESRAHGSEAASRP